jgi:molybdopterin-containing oxidoreductase family membrane subunit
MYYGTIGLFFALMFLFIRVLPVISIAEMRELVAETRERHGDESHGGHHDDDDDLDLAASSG